MKKGRELLEEIFRHYNYFVSFSRTDPTYLVAKKGDVRIAVGYFFGDREVVVYDLKRFLSAAEESRYTGFFYITNTKFEYHARKFAQEMGIILWERKKLVEELGKIRLAQFEKEAFGEKTSQVQPPFQPLPQSQIFEVKEPKSFSERLRYLFSEKEKGSDFEKEDVLPQKRKIEEKEYFINLKVSLEDIYKKFKKGKVLGVTLHYVPYFCFDYSCEIYNEKSEFEKKKKGCIAVNGITGQCEEWSGELEAEEVNKAGGLKVTPRYKPDELWKKVKDAIITTNTTEEFKNGRQRWFTPKKETVYYSYKGTYYLPFYNVALQEKNIIVDATTGREE